MTDGPAGVALRDGIVMDARPSCATPQAPLRLGPLTEARMRA